MSRSGSLIVVGTGIRLVAQLTPEALASIERAERLLYLVTEPATKAWMQSLNPGAESLEDCYGPDKPRSASYDEMVARILAPVRAGLNVCVAFYGHPGVFVRPSHDAIRIAHAEGFAARMLPGISAEDCLFADIGVDPAQEGCQSFEATDFLARPPRFDPRSGLLLWQVGVIGEPSLPAPGARKRTGLRLLAERLCRHYPPGHRAVVYEAAVYPVCGPVIRRVRLSALGRTQVPLLATLYVPPRALRRLSVRTLRALSLSVHRSPRGREYNGP
jgi:Tetrapyrrole (Corrin/Porphyrin) Methylases